MKIQLILEIFPTSLHYIIKLDIIPLLNQILHEKQKEKAQADESRDESRCRHVGVIPFVTHAITHFIINPLKHYNHDNDNKENSERDCNTSK